MTGWRLVSTAMAIGDPHSAFDAGSLGDVPGQITVVLTKVAHLVLVLSAGFAVVAVPLAMVGWFRWFTLLPLTLVIAAGLYFGDRTAPIIARSPTWPTIAVLASITLSTILGLAHPTQFFSTSRDPGVYAVTALWLEREGEILFPAPAEEFRGVDGVSGAGAGFYPGRDDGRLEPQFAHLTHTLLGGAATVGGEAALTRINVLVGAGALLVLFLLIQQISHGWAAAASTSALAFTLPQMYFARGPYSEPLAQLLLLGGLAVLISRPNLSRSHALLAGLLFGAVLGSRIDAVLVASGLIAVLAAWLVGRSRTEGSRVIWVGAGVVVTAGIGLLDLRLFTSRYLDALWGQFRTAAFLVAFTAALAALALLLQAKIRRRARQLESRLETLGSAMAAAVWLGALHLLFLRPLWPNHRSDPEAPVSREIGRLQARQGLPDEPTRTYSEQAGEWIAWYVGWPLVLTAVLGAAVVAYRLLTKWSWPLFAVLGIAGLPTLVYLWQPSITPDHLFAMRRFVPTALPLVAVLGAIGMVELRRMAALSLQWKGLSAQLAISALVVVPAMAVSQPYWTFREFRMDTSGLNALCESFDGSPVLVDDTGAMGRQYVAGFTAACGVEAAWVNPDQLDSALLVASNYQESGRELILVSQRPDLDTELSEVRLKGSEDFRVHEIERAVSRVPIGSDPATGATTLYLYEVNRS